MLFRSHEFTSNLVEEIQRSHEVDDESLAEVTAREREISPWLIDEAPAAAELQFGVN